MESVVTSLSVIWRSCFESSSEDSSADRRGRGSSRDISGEAPTSETPSRDDSSGDGVIRSLVEERALRSFVEEQEELQQRTRSSAFEGNAG